MAAGNGCSGALGGSQETPSWRGHGTEIPSRVQSVVDIDNDDRCIHADSTTEWVRLFDIAQDPATAVEAMPVMISRGYRDDFGVGQSTYYNSAGKSPSPDVGV